MKLIFKGDIRCLQTRFVEDDKKTMILYFIVKNGHCIYRKYN